MHHDPPSCLSPAHVACVGCCWCRRWAGPVPGGDAVSAQDRLAEIRARVEAATSYDYDDDNLGTEQDLAAFVADQDAKEALARTDVPALLAALDAVMAEVDAAEELADMAPTSREESIHRLYGRGLRRAIDTALGGGRDE